MIEEGPGEHDAHLMDDDETETVDCPRCGQAIWAYTQRCDYCGVNFSGEAWQFEIADEDRRPLLFWPAVVIVVIVVVVVLSLF